MNVLSREYFEGLFDDYRKDPASVPPEWRAYFAQFDDPTHANANANDLVVTSSNVVADSQVKPTGRKIQLAQLQDRVDQLIRSYRVRGHLAARIDPLDIPRPEQPELEIESCGLLKSDLDKKFSTRTMGGVNVQTLREIVTQMRNTYCRYIGVQFMHIDDFEVRRWLQQRMEESENRLELPRDQQVRILTKLTDAEIFESFVRRNMSVPKRFHWKEPRA